MVNRIHSLHQRHDTRCCHKNHCARFNKPRSFQVASVRPVASRKRCAKRVSTDRCGLELSQAQLKLDPRRNHCFGIQSRLMTTAPNIVALSSPQADFDRFWALYPRKTSKLDAMKAWQKAITMETPENILIALAHQRKHRESWHRDGGQFIPYPASWLRAGGFWDECGPVLLTGSTSLNSGPSRAAAIAYAKSCGDDKGYVLGWYQKHFESNFTNPESLGWQALFIKDFTRHQQTQTSKI